MLLPTDINLNASAVAMLALQKAASILQLPNEVRFLIVLHLEAPELENLRQTCRAFVSFIDDEVWRRCIYDRLPLSASQEGPQIKSSWREDALFRSQILKRFNNYKAGSTSFKPKHHRHEHSYNAELHELYLSNGYATETTFVDCFTGKQSHCQESLLDAEIGLGQPTSIIPLSVGFLYAFHDGTLALMGWHKETEEWGHCTLSGSVIAGLKAAAFAEECLVTLDASGNVMVWNFDTLQCIGSAETRVSLSQLFTDGKQIMVIFHSNIIGDEDAFDLIEIETMNSGRVQASPDWENFASVVAAIDWVGKQIVTSDEDVYAVMRFDGTLAYEPDNCGFIALAPGRHAVTASEDGLIRCMHLDDFETCLWSSWLDVTEQMHGDCDCGTCVFEDIPTSIAVNNTFVAVGRKDGSVSILDFLSGQVQTRILPDTKRYSMETAVPGWSLASCCDWPAVETISLHPFLARGVAFYHTSFVAFDLKAP